jgi:hypothetical protein
LRDGLASLDRTIADPLPGIDADVAETSAAESIGDRLHWRGARLPFPHPARRASAPPNQGSIVLRRSTRRHGCQAKREFWLFSTFR